MQLCSRSHTAVCRHRRDFHATLVHTSLMSWMCCHCFSPSTPRPQYVATTIINTKPHPWYSVHVQDTINYYHLWFGRYIFCNRVVVCIYWFMSHKTLCVGIRKYENKQKCWLVLSRLDYINRCIFGCSLLQRWANLHERLCNCFNLDALVDTTWVWIFNLGITRLQDWPLTYQSPPHINSDCKN